MLYEVITRSSPSVITSPILMPMRNHICRSSVSWAFRTARSSCIKMAQRTASTVVNANYGGPVAVPLSLVRSSGNVLAVELHQASSASSMPMLKSSRRRPSDRSTSSGWRYTRTKRSPGQRAAHSSRKSAARGSLKPRITSYNVGYTKLLRSSNMSGGEFNYRSY